MSDSQDQTDKVNDTAGNLDVQDPETAPAPAIEAAPSDPALPLTSGGKSPLFRRNLKNWVKEQHH
ncbi:hypothetical protein IMZ48_09115 [Candidatus Bathyarchaeota archaeon]|nr:hypothetical protein [Candidatus Bathyarchaeota archaeon]